MKRYLISRIIRGIFSIIIMVSIIMIMIYSALDRNQVFASDPTYRNLGNNQKIVYKYRKWADYGYLDYVTYSDYLLELRNDGEITEEQRLALAKFAKTPKGDSDEVAEYVKKYTEYYTSKGYTVERLDAVMMGPNKVASGGAQQLFAYKDIPLINRVVKYFSGLISVDNVHNVKEDIEDRGLKFTLHDPLKDGSFSPAIMGNGTLHKYLLYFDGEFPFIHQNLITINLGKSYTVNQGIDVFETMTSSQGSYVMSLTKFPTGLEEMSADDLHTARYVAGSRASSKVYEERFTDDYTNVITNKNGLSKIGYSFVIGIISVLLAYLLGIPLGILLARKKDKLADKIGMIYIIFISAVPSLAYIFMFKALGGRLGLPTTFNMESGSLLMYVLPIVSLALPSVAGLMKWLRRYMVDQMNSDYVKFARSGGLTEREIFSKHILKNAIIPIVHGVPASILGALVGAIITERVYVVPGAGNLLTKAINMYDNGVIVGVSLFYAVLSVASIILGDVLMSIVDPRISFTSKDR